MILKYKDISHEIRNHRSVLAGIQRMVELCEQRGYGWCLWAHGDWANGFDTIGAKIKTTISYPLITGPKRSKRGRS